MTDSSNYSPQSMQETTPSSISGRNNRTLSYSSTAPHLSPSSFSTLPVEVITRAVEFYFRHIHRQPLWLFEKKSLSPSNIGEDLVHAIVALGITYNPEDYSEDNLQSPQFYSKAARKGAMLKIAEGSMTIQSTQTLCLLAYSSFICKFYELMASEDPKNF
ncbi:hypothetical protein NW762_010577 [Fusarium torreyae]|uniref:Transcription factor domain-containing protein n=1 Tax=Fusarium torreyae TaxID=1237075 RepID=A0A9W8VAA8_9HYPO|nr:hypothetical protein NW762_010577 [Fusarium torreyae]